MSSARGDVAGFRSAAALNGLIRAHRAGGIDPVDGLSEATWRERIAARFLAELEAKPAYAQCSVLSALTTTVAKLFASIVPDRTGRSGSSPMRSAATKRRSALLQGHDRPAGERNLRVAIDLNRRMDTSKNPMCRPCELARRLRRRRKAVRYRHCQCRYAAGVRPRSVFGAAGREHVRGRRAEATISFIPTATREFGSQLGKPTDWQGDFPDLAASAGATQSIARHRAGSGRTPGGIALAPARLAGSEWIARDRDRTEHRHHGAGGGYPEYSSLLVGLIAVLCAAALAILIAKVAHPADHAIDGGGRKRRPQRYGHHPGRCAAARPACWRARLRG